MGGNRQYFWIPSSMAANIEGDFRSSTQPPRPKVTRSGPAQSQFALLEPNREPPGVGFQPTINNCNGAPQREPNELNPQSRPSSERNRSATIGGGG